MPRLIDRHVCCCCLPVADAAAAAGVVAPQAADWKSARRWRLAAVDSGTFSFADLTFEQQQPTQQQGGSSKSNSKQRHSRQQPVLLPQQHASSSSGGGATAAGSSSGYRVMSVEGSRLVGGHVVLLTWPPDGRYSPWQSSQPPLQVERGSADGSSSGKGVAVRALVVPMNTAAAAGGGGANSSSAGEPWSGCRHCLMLRLCITVMRLAVCVCVAPPLPPPPHTHRPVGAHATCCMNAAYEPSTLLLCHLAVPCCVYI